jgi:biopolymer transport protein ExbD
MKLRRVKKSAFSESPALSDLAFLLIIYFIVIAGFNVTKGFLVNLPAKGSVRIVPKDELLRFELDRAGVIRYGGAALSRAEAEKEIRAALARQPNTALVLSVAGETPWQAVVSFVEMAQRLEASSFSFKLQADGTGANAPEGGP